MRLIYQLIHHGYKLRDKAPKVPSRFARLLGAKKVPVVPVTFNSLDFLFSNTGDDMATRSNHVAKQSTLNFFVDYLSGFFFFHSTSIQPKSQLVTFKLFKQRYRGVSSLDTNACPLSSIQPSRD